MSSLLPPTERVKKNNDVEITAKIKSSLKTGNAKELVLLFDKDVELLIDGEKVEFPKIKNTHAEQILKSFFKKRPPNDFQFVYQGNAASIRYSTGTYQSGNDSYLVYILMKATSGHYLIETLQFRKEIPNKTAKL
jgi:hypothetical protein